MQRNDILINEVLQLAFLYMTEEKVQLGVEWVGQVQRRKIRYLSKKGCRSSLPITDDHTTYKPSKPHAPETLLDLQ